MGVLCIQDSDESMVIGALQFELLLPGACSLKDKRQVVRSVKDRLHREHQVSVAEVADHDLLNRAVLGLAVVACDGNRAGQVLDRITNKLRQLTSAELGHAQRFIMPFSSFAQDFDASHEQAQTQAMAELAAELLERGEQL